MRALTTLAIVSLLAGPTAFAQDQASHEGLKVHGHWTIDVRNPDGTLASHHEFENALTLNGQQLLSRVLAHEPRIINGWEVEFRAPLPNGSTGITIAEPSVVSAIPIPDSRNLTASRVQLQIVLAGSVQAPSTLSLTEVNSKLETQTPDGLGIYLETFSSRTLAQPVLVNAGQIVQVTVTFSFS
jgi:hypothetical protein